MIAKKWFLFVAVLAFAAYGFAQGQQQAHKSEGVHGDATSNCQSTFTSGTNLTYFQFCTTINGNVTEFQTPAGVEHIREGSYDEGYGICDFDTLNRYYDFADGGDSGNWLASVISQPGGPSTFPLKITRTTSDGVFTLTQSFTRTTTVPTVNITMTLKNQTAVSKDYALVRYADIDANNADGGDFNNYFDFDWDSAWGYNPGFNTHGVSLFTIPTNTTRFAFVQDTSDIPDPCGPVNNLPPSTPWYGDGSVGYDWNGTLGPHKSITVNGGYRRF